MPPGSSFRNSTTRFRDHQAHQSLRLRGAGHARRELSQGLRSRSGLGLRRRVWHSTGRSTKRPRAKIAKTFIEAIAAPDYAPGALDAAGAKKNLRLLKVAATPLADLVVKSISGGYLAQTADLHRLDRAQAAGEDEARPDRRGMAGAGVRLEGVEAREVERDRVRARRPDRRRRAPAR